MAPRRKKFQEKSSSSCRGRRIVKPYNRLVDEPDLDVSKPTDHNVLFEFKFHCGGSYDRRKGSYIPSYVMNIENIQSNYFNVRLVQNMVKLVIGIKWAVKLYWVDPYLGVVRNLESSEDILSILCKLRLYKSFIVLVEEIMPDGDIEFDNVEFVILSDDDESEEEHINEPELFYMLEWKDDWNRNPRRKRIKMCDSRRRTVKKKKVVKETIVVGESSKYDQVETGELGDYVQTVCKPGVGLLEYNVHKVVEEVHAQVEDQANIEVDVVDNVQEQVQVEQGEQGDYVQPVEDQIFGKLEDFDWAKELEYLFDCSRGNLQQKTYLNNVFGEEVGESEAQVNEAEVNEVEVNEAQVNEPSEEQVNEEQVNEEQVSEEHQSKSSESSEANDQEDETEQQENEEENDDESSDDEESEESNDDESSEDENHVQSGQNEPVYNGEKDWCSDPDDPDELKSLHSDSDHVEDEEEEVFPEFNEAAMMDDPYFKLGMKFSDGDQVRRVIKQYAILNRKNIRLLKNESWRIRAKCDPPCNWVVYISRKGKEDTMQVKTLLDKHENCRPVYESHIISSTWLAKHYLETNWWNHKWPIDSFQQKVREDFGCQLSRNTLYNARNKAYKLLVGDHEMQYQQLYHYCKTLKNAMPGTTCQLNYTTCPEGRRFRRMYVSLGPLKQGFLQGCRNVVCIDACFLSGPYKAQLMSAVGIDANDGMWPIAYAVVEKERKKSWAWFLKLLVEDLGIQDASTWTFMSDQQKGLIPALKMVIPEVAHRLCARHIHSNMKQDHGRKGVKDAFWNCARATTVEYFNLKVEKLKKKKYSAWSWLQTKAPSPDHWSKSHFNTISKSDILTNNHVEIFNKFILEARSLPIIDMFEKIRLLIQKRTRTNRDIMRKYPGIICPRIIDKLEKQRKLSAKYIAYWNGGSRFEICGPTYKVVVDLAERTCQCRLWQLTGIPCSHAMAAIMYRAEDPDDYVHICYHKSTYLKSYENLIEGISGPELWLSSSKQPLLAPINTTQPGRPKRKRNKQNDEPSSAVLKKMKHPKQPPGKCSVCGSVGHSKRTCKKQRSKKNTNQASTSGTKKQTVRRKGM